MTTDRHFEPLRPNRNIGIPDRYEFTHGVDSVCVYDYDSMDFISEIAVGQTPDCHATSLDNRYLYIACCGKENPGLFCIDQSSLTLAKKLETGPVFGPNVLPDGETMILHDHYGGLLILKDINDMSRIRIHKRVEFLHTNTYGDTLGGKGGLIESGRYYVVGGWFHNSIYAMDLSDNYIVTLLAENGPHLKNVDDLVIGKDETKAYCACYNDRENCFVTVFDIPGRNVTKRIKTGRGTCGLTMTNDKRFVVASNDADDAISIIDTETDEPARIVSARRGFNELGINGYIQGISIGRDDEVFVYDCSGNGALVRFRNIAGQWEWTVSWAGGKSSGMEAPING